jgi:hypothetical protein
MNIHSNARTCPNSRAVIVDHVRAKAWSEDQAAAMGVSARTGFKWRFREEHQAGPGHGAARPALTHGAAPGRRSPAPPERPRAGTRSGAGLPPLDVHSRDVVQ